MDLNVISEKFISENGLPFKVFPFLKYSKYRLRDHGSCKGPYVIYQLWKITSATFLFLLSESTVEGILIHSYT